MVPNAPNMNIANSPRLKYWSSLFSSMGKLICIPTIAKQTESVNDILLDIRYSVIDKIRYCKTTFASRPIVLVAFNFGSLIAFSCALQLPKPVWAIICLGFPIKGYSGIRGVRMHSSKRSLVLIFHFFPRSWAILSSISMCQFNL